MVIPAPVDPAALARSLRLPPRALRIVDLSALPPHRREAENGRLAAETGMLEIPPRLRMRVEVLPDEPGDALGEMDWLVFGPEIPRRAEEKVYASPLEYWAERVAELPPPPGLPATISAGIPSPLRRRLTELDVETWAELRSRAAWAGISPAALFLAALADALAAWSASPRLTVELALTGTPGGLWVPLALDGGSPVPFEERARGVQERLRRDLAYPLPRSVRPEGLSALPVAVALPPRLFRQEGEEEVRDGGRRPARGRVREPLLLQLQAAEREGGLLLFWDVAEASFPPGLVEALTAAFRDLLRRLSAGPSWKEVRRRLIPPQQLARMVAFNTTGSPLPEPYPWELFAARARRQPERIAVTGPCGSTTYGSLFQTSSRLGHLLQRHGARRNSPVAVVLEPGPDAVAAILGVLAAGAAYLPVDPALPPDRFRSLLEHGRIELAVTREGLADALDWPEEIAGVMMDGLPDDFPEGSPPVPSASPKDLACILSGVMLENRGVANLATDLVRRFAIGPGDRTLALSPLSEGPSLFEVFGTLAAGGTLVFGEEEGVTVRVASPSRIRTRTGAAELRGSLETTVWAAVHEPGEDSASFGRPLSNLGAHVLDGRMELCPFWVEGDLYLSGTGLARGYWRDPARSAARFVIHPDTGERLFRTGRRARWVPDGRIEVL
jgi:non-ribosomal peptide synthetase component F